MPNFPLSFVHIPLLNAQTRLNTRSDQSQIEHITYDTKPKHTTTATRQNGGTIGRRLRWPEGVEDCLQLQQIEHSRRLAVWICIDAFHNAVVQRPQARCLLIVQRQQLSAKEQLQSRPKEIHLIRTEYRLEQYEDGRSDVAGGRQRSHCLDNECIQCGPLCVGRRVNRRFA